MSLWIIATFVAFFVKGLCGFANTLVLTSILSFGANNISISPVELVLGYPSNLILAIKERKSIDFKKCIPVAMLVLIGCVPGILFLKNTDTTVIKIVFGFVIIGIAVEMLLRTYIEGKSKDKKPGKQSKVVLTIIGLLSGILCGLYGIGALLGAYFSRVTKDSKAFKANICVVFLIENTFRIVMYSLLGIITLESLKYSLILNPVMIIGLLLGMFSAKFLKDKYAKVTVMILLLLSGVSLVMTNLL